MPPVIFLLDGHALAYRTYFALTRGSTSFTTKAGEPTAGVFGFTSVLLRILEQDHPDYIAVAFDTGKTFRDKLFPEYKGTRAKMPDDLRPQMERIRQIVDAFNIPRLEVENYEADDVIGSVAQAAVKRGLGVKIITGDRDLLQLVDERILVNLPGKSLADARDYHSADVVEFLGVRPDQIVDFKALTGDKSDNIPGVTGIGEKTAVSLLAQYGTLDGIYAHLDELAPGVRKKLEEGRENAYLSYKLATIEINLPVAVDWEKARTEQFDPHKVEALFRQLEFRTLLDRLTALYPLYGKRAPADNAGIRAQQLNFLDGAPQSVQIVSRGEIQVEIVDTAEKLHALASRLQQAKILSLDTETTSTDQMSARLVGISMAMDQERGYYIPVGHNEGLGQQLPGDTVLQALQKPLADPGLPKVGHNIKYD